MDRRKATKSTDRSKKTETSVKTNSISSRDGNVKRHSLRRSTAEANPQEPVVAVEKKKRTAVDNTANVPAAVRRRSTSKLHTDTTGVSAAQVRSDSSREQDKKRTVRKIRATAPSSEEKPVLRDLNEVPKSRTPKVAETIRPKVAHDEPFQVQVASDQQDDDGPSEYEDDFEDYDSDFEQDDDEQQIDDYKNVAEEHVMKDSDELALDVSAVVQETDLRVTYSEVPQPSLQESESNLESDSGWKPSLKSRPPTKSKSRGEQLLDLIKLDDVGFDLFSLPPKTYDECMQSFASGDNKSQKSTQTGDEDDTDETQTDLVETGDVWTQHPAGFHGAIGGGRISSTLCDSFQITSSKSWKRLSGFLYRASQIVCSLIEEDERPQRLEEKDSGSESTDFSKTVVHLRPPSFLRGRSVSFVSSSKVRQRFILAVYDDNSAEVNDNMDDVLRRKSVLCVWNARQPRAPQKVLTSPCQPRCCCFGQSVEFTFAGLEDGSVAVWDLREPDGLHRRYRYSYDGGSGECVLRAPTYSTAEVMGLEGHLGPVVAIFCQEDEKDASVKSQGLMQYGIVQLTTLEEDAVVCVWVVTETSRPDPAGDETNLGLAPGGKVQLVKSSTIRLQGIPKLRPHLETHPCARDFACRARDANRFYVATDTGAVVTCAIYDDEENAIFVPSEESLATAVAANSIDFSPIGEPQCFLVGCGDGSVRLHSVLKEKPLMTWAATSEDGEAVRKVAWSPSRPNVFYVLDGQGRVHVWDLSESDCEPVRSTSASHRRVTHMDVGSDWRRPWNGAADDATNGQRPYIVFGCDDGTTEVHYVNDRFAKCDEREKLTFAKYVELL